MRRPAATVVALGALTLLAPLAACQPKTVQDGVKAVPDATAAQCRTDKEVLQAGLDSYSILEGKPPASEAEMVAAGYLRAESKYYDIGAAGTIVLAPGSNCQP